MNPRRTQSQESITRRTAVVPHGRQAPQSTGGGTSHGSGNRGSSALGKCVEDGRGCFLHQPCCCHSHQRVVIAEHLAGPMPGAALQGIIAPAGHPAMGQGAANLSEDSEQAGNSSWLFADTVIRALQKALPTPIHGGTPTWWQRNGKRAGDCIFKGSF